MVTSMINVCLEDVVISELKYIQVILAWSVGPVELAIFDVYML